VRKLLAAAIVVGLLVAHQDYWQWNRNELVFGFLPHTIAWHMGLCLVTALAWVVITRICWPTVADHVNSEPTAPAAGQVAGMPTAPAAGRQPPGVPEARRP
jgi:hypothetical protein